MVATAKTTDATRKAIERRFLETPNRFLISKKKVPIDYLPPPKFFKVYVFAKIASLHRSRIEISI